MLVPPHLPAEQAQRRHQQGVCDFELAGGLDVARTHCGSSRCDRPAFEIAGTDSIRFQLGHIAKAGASAPAHGDYKLPGGASAGASGSQTRPAESPARPRRGEGQREVQRQRSREGPEREGERKGQGGRPEEVKRDGPQGLEAYETPGAEERQGSSGMLPCQEREMREGPDCALEIPPETRPFRRGLKKQLRNERPNASWRMARKEICWRRMKRKKSLKGCNVKSGLKSEWVGDESLPMAEYAEPMVAATAVGVESCTGSCDQPEFSSGTSCNLGVGQARDTGKEASDEFEGVTLGDILTWLDSRMDAFLARHCKTTSTGRLFPLPTSSCFLASLFPHKTPVVRSVLRCLLVSLNSLNGEGTVGAQGASEYQKTVIQGLVEDCERVAGWVLDQPNLTWSEFFRVKGVDYRGEEVLTAQTMRWENVSPALPSEVGSVPLEDVLSLGCQHYVNHFEDYLLAPEDQVAVKPPRVMVPPEDWELFCSKLLEMGVFSRVHEDDLYQVEGRPLLNGLFGVSKHENVEGIEVMRIIMNLIPLNSVCRAIDGDVSTLPSWAGMAPLHLQPHEQLLISSEDVRAFFYIFRVPVAWHRFLCFNRPLPSSLCGEKAGRWFPCSAVLPMGFRNSVSLAQAVHRFIVNKDLNKLPSVGRFGELRKDRPFSVSNPLCRIYLDNYDELEKASKEIASVIAGQVSPLTQSLQETYAEFGVPRHPKKGVARQLQAEVQGALVDGDLGMAYPKTEKVMRYVKLGMLLLQEGVSSQKQMQIVGGGFVYLAMFRRPLLGSLNCIWEFIVGCEGSPPWAKFPIPVGVKHEIARFLGLVPLAYMNFRCAISDMVTASDASESGGGVTASLGLTPLGVVASKCDIRGDVMEPEDIPGVLTVGLFDGIGALRVAADALGWNVLGHVSVEKNPKAARVVESHFPNTILVSHVEDVDLEMVQQWAQRFSQVAVVVVGGGPPCQGVSGLNASRKGALRDARSCLYVHVARSKALIRKCFPWAQVRGLMESVASVDIADEKLMSESFGCSPWHIDAAGVSLAHRPRLYWLDWELMAEPGVQFGVTPVGRSAATFKVELDAKLFLNSGWKRTQEGKFPTFTTSRPSAIPGYKPAGIKNCNEQGKALWAEDLHRFPPYQYQVKHCLRNKRGQLRVPNIHEREVIMGFPKDYTYNCVPKGEQGKVAHMDERLTLIGNSWNVTVVSWLLCQLGRVIGLNPCFTLGEIVQRTSPGCTVNLQTYLRRPPLEGHFGSKTTTERAKSLVEKLLTMVSQKGEDLMIQASSEELSRYQRLRMSIPARLWKWGTVASWKWTGDREHINSLELRAVLTALRWRLERHKKVQVKFVHLLDSMVGLHALSRGRSSSKRLRRTVLRINALLLATRSQGVWTYVHTHQNPADAPSRRPLKRKWTKCRKGS